MKQGIIHIVWLVVAAAAFAIGNFTRPLQGGGAQSGEASGSSVLATTASNTSNASKGASGKTSPGAGGGRNADFLMEFSDAAGVFNSKAMGDAVRAALRETDPVESSALFAQLLSNISPENAEAAMEAINQTVAGRDAWQYQALLMYAWGKVDGAGAVAKAQEVGGRGAMFGTMRALSGWAGSEPDEAIAWLESQEYGEGREAGWQKSMNVRGLIEGLAKTDIAAATEYLGSIDDQGQRRDLIGTIANEKIRDGLDEASTWAVSLPDDGMKENALETVARQYIRDDIEKAAQWASQYASEGYGEDAVREVTEEYAERSPEEAIQWVGQLAEGGAQNGAYREAMDEWAEKDPDAAAEYLTGMDEGLQRDNAISGFAREHAEQDPEAAAIWASSIGDEGTRIETLNRTWNEWNGKEPDAAVEWLGGLGLSDAQVEKVTARPERQNRGSWWGR